MSIEDLKAKYGRIYKYSMGGVDYIYRPLRMGEFYKISRMEDVEEKELEILKTSIVSHTIKHMKDIPSGVAENLVTLISKVTDISQERVLEKVQQYRDDMGMADDFIKWKTQLIKILNYTPEEIDRMDLDSFTQAIVMAEEVVGMPLVSIDGSETPEPVNQEPEKPSPGEMGPEADKSVNSLRRAFIEGKRRRFRKA